MTTVTVDFAWLAAGELRHDGAKPAFPALPAAPGLYRITFHPSDGAPRVYIGETDTSVNAPAPTGIRARHSGRACA